MGTHARSLAAARSAHAPHPRACCAQAILQALLEGLSSVMGAMASQPPLLRVFPGLAAPPAEAALAQWAACGALGGTPVRALNSEAINEALPWAPEFCGWAVSVMGVPLAEAQLPLRAAQTFLATLRSSARPARACGGAEAAKLPGSRCAACRAAQTPTLRSR